MRHDATGKLSDSPVVKFLVAQKMICYGMSVNAFKDYFQIGELTGDQCLSKLCTGIVSSLKYSNLCLRFPTRSDAQRVVNLHKEVHGIDCMIGSLDVTKIHWLSCPTAWKGQFEGREGIPTIGFEAVADYNLWIWHSAFGFPGLMNGINIWERSPLLELMIMVLMTKLILILLSMGNPFWKLYNLVDGIHPLLSRFVPIISDPSTRSDQEFAKKQESIEKSIERVFGLLRKKFLALSSGMRFYAMDDIFYVVKAAVVMHNMMLEERIRYDDIDSEEHYVEIELERENMNPHELAILENEVHNNVVRVTVMRTEYSFKYESAARKWNELNHIGNAIKLKDALKKHMYKTRYGDEGLLECEAISDDLNPLLY